MDHRKYTPLFVFVKTVPDPRKARGKVFQWEFLLLGVCGALVSGQQSGSAISDWIVEHAREITAYLRIRLRRTPSHSTIRRALRHVDIEALQRVMAEHSQALERGRQASGSVAETARQPLCGQAIDGKEVRGAGVHGIKVHLLSLVQHRSGIVLAQQEIGEKTNEIPTVPELLAGRDLRGIVITLDAMNTQRATAQSIIAQGGHYLMVVKGNQPALYGDIKTFFTGTFLPREDDRDTYTGWNKAHGRLETRILTCSEGLQSYLGWPGAKQVAKRQCLRKVVKTGKVSSEITYAVTSLSRQQAGSQRLGGGLARALDD